MKTHLYTLCWNEADMLEFFFRNYDPWVDRYIVFDDGSTDGSIEILQSRPLVEIRPMRRQFPDSHIMSQKELLNEVWKESRGRADWVVIVDIDEHLYAPQSPMRDLLARYKSQGITLVPALGFQTLSEDFPKADELLVKSRALGTPWHEMCKLSVINPDAIEETNFSIGRHTAKPAGNVKFPKRDELLLFHYKYLGFERTLIKQDVQNSRRGAYDISMGINANYAWSRRELRGHWDDFLKASEDLSWPNCNPDRYPFSYRWWRFFPRWLIRARRFIRNPKYMIKLLIKNIASRARGLPPENFGLFIEKINRSSIRKELYKMTILGSGNGTERDSVVASNADDARGVLIQCLHSADAHKLQSARCIQKVIAAKKENEEKYQKEFDAFVITNSKGFPASAVKFANNKNVKLVSRKDLIEFISQVNIS